MFMITDDAFLWTIDFASYTWIPTVLCIMLITVMFTIGSEKNTTHFHLSKSEIADLTDDINNLVIAKFKCETNSRPITEFIA